MERTRQVYKACLEIIPHKKVVTVDAMVPCLVQYLFYFSRPKYVLTLQFTVLLIQSKKLFFFILVYFCQDMASLCPIWNKTTGSIKRKEGFGKVLCNENENFIYTLFAHLILFTRRFVLFLINPFPPRGSPLTSKIIWC